MFATMGYGVYLFFASLMICAAIFVYFLVPETKGIPLEAMDRLFSRSLPTRRAHTVVLAQVRAEEARFRQVELDGKGSDAEIQVEGKIETLVDGKYTGAV